MYLLIGYFSMRCFSQRGQGMAEYALVLAFVVAVIVLVSNADLVQAINNVFSRVSSGIVNR